MDFHFCLFSACLGAIVKKTNFGINTQAPQRYEIKRCCANYFTLHEFQNIPITILIFGSDNE